MEFNEQDARLWMQRRVLRAARNGLVGIAATALAEDYCFEEGDEDWLDDDGHPIWQVAHEVRTDYENRQGPFSKIL